MNKGYVDLLGRFEPASMFELSICTLLWEYIHERKWAVLFELHREF